MCLLLTAPRETSNGKRWSTERAFFHAICSPFSGFSGAPRSPFVNMMSSRHSYFSVISIVFVFFLQRLAVVWGTWWRAGFALFSFLRVRGRTVVGKAVMPRRWDIFGGEDGVYVFFMMWYGVWERWERCILCQVRFRCIVFNSHMYRVVGVIAGYSEHLRL